MAIPPAKPKTPEEQMQEYLHTPPPPPPSYAKGPGRWVGNQWIEYSVIPDYPDYPGEPGWTTKPPPPPPPPAETPAAPPTTPPVQPPSSGGGGDGGGGGGTPTPSSVSAVYQNILQQLLNTTGPSGGGGGGVGPYTPLPKSEYDDLVHQYILKMLGGPTAEEAGAAAAHSEPVNAYRQSILRDLEKSRAGTAEMAGITGTDASGGFFGTIQGLKQAAGESTAKFTGEYVDKAMAARRQELQQAVQMAQQQGNFEEAQALSRYGMELTAAVQREANANQRFATEVTKLLGMGDQELRKYIADKQFEASMSASGSAANSAADRLALDYAIFEEQNRRWNLTFAANPPKV